MGTGIPLDEGEQAGEKKIQSDVVTAIGNGGDLFYLEQEKCKGCVEEVCSSKVCALKQELDAASEMRP